MSLACVLLWCFTGTHFNDVHRSGASLATKRMTRTSLIMRGAPPVRSLAEISNAFLDVFGFGGSCRFRLCASLLWCCACYHLNDCMSSHA